MTRKRYNKDKKLQPRKALIKHFKVDDFCPDVALCKMLADELKVPEPSNVLAFRRFMRLNYKKVTRKKPAKPKTAKQASKDFFQSRSWKHVRYAALSNSNGACQCCGAKASDGVQIHVDHIKPRSIYPELALDLDNLQILCSDCNIGKSNIFEDDWRDNGKNLKH